MVTKPKSYRRELERLAAEAYLAAANARQDVLKAKLAARQAAATARRLRATAKAIDKGTGEPGGSGGFHRARARVKTEWPFYTALFRAKLSLPEWARRQTEPPLSAETARNWMKPSSSRKVPESWARRIHKEFPEVPVADEAWPKGISWGR